MRLYRVILGLVLPVLAGWQAWQEWRGRVPAGTLAERLAHVPAPEVKEHGTIWLHGASNGELTSARWLIETLIARRPDLHLVITSNSLTARDMVAAWGLPRVTARLAPFDSRAALGRFLGAWRARALIFLENELWPERITRMGDHGPVICIGARMSGGSARSWARFAPGLIARILGQLSLVSAQDAGSEARLIALGLPPARLGPRLMLKARAQPATVAGALPFVPAPPRARILLAASTHPGEDEVVLDGFMAARAQFDLLILAPRHPRRGDAIAALVEARGLRGARRSAGQLPQADTSVYLADTLGEMAHWYAMAGATVIGGTFGDAGGHTPYEPAAAGSAILHGPGTANFAEVFARLDAEDAAIEITAAGLGQALTGLDAARQTRLAKAATATLGPGDEDQSAALIAALLAALPPA